MTDRLVQAIVLVEELDAARARAERAGFGVVAGGRHPGRGTANLVIPFGSQYLELLAIVDHAEAAATPQGVPVLTALERRGPGLARWSIEPDDIDKVGERLGLVVEDRERTRPDGVIVRWRSVGVDEAWAEPWRAAYMAWADPALHPARTAVTHPNGATGFASLRVGAPDAAAALAWLGGAAPAGVTIDPSDPDALQLTLATPGGPVPLDL